MDKPGPHHHIASATALEDGHAPRPFALSVDALANLIANRDTAWLATNGGVAAIAAALHTCPENGLSALEQQPAHIQARIAHYGENKFTYPPPKSFLRLTLEAFQDLTIIILCVAAIVSLAIGLAVSAKRREYAYLEGIAICIVVLIVVLVQAGIDHQKEAKFRHLNSVKDQFNVHVTRAANVSALPADQLLVGDVIRVTAGDKIPADALLLSGSSLKTNESAMTGEPIDVDKDVHTDAFLLSGTTVSEGVATVLIVAVGHHSQWGVILKGLVVEPEDTPLQHRLDQLSWTIGKFGIVFAVLTFTVSIFRWIARSKRSGEWDASLVLDFFIDAVTIVVVAIPEGLPLAITLGLAFAMRKMMRDNNLVRRLEACETMGSATQLNADKTGTLTQNRMTVVEAYWQGRHVRYDDFAVDDDTDAPDAFLGDGYRTAVTHGMCVNTQANLQVTDGVVHHLGNKTECALLQHANRWRHDYRRVRKENPAHRVYMFDSTKKSMTTTVELSESRVRAYTKGAPDILIHACTQELSEDGESFMPLTAARRGDIVACVDQMAARGLRTLLLAMRDIQHDAQDRTFWDGLSDDELAFVGVVGIKDPIRPETKEAVRQLQQAGVTVRMVTGDNALTAAFIAKEAGILDDDGVVMEGPQFRDLSDEELGQVALRIQVLARSTPHDKLVLVHKLKQLGEVVSVTGDGTNDGPALKEADVGFALGIAGTEVAKEACDIVILDDNIQSMTKAVLWGRNVYESIRKFLQFQLVVNVVAVTLNFISACAGVELPLGAVPLLWVNMIMDSMGALALATEAPRKELLERKPYGRRAPLINREMYRNIIGVSIYQLVVSLVLQFAGRGLFNITCDMASGQATDECEVKIMNSVIFNVFVFMQIGSELNSRRIGAKNIFDGLSRSGWFIGIIAATIGVQVGLMVGVGSTQVGRNIGIQSVDGKAWIAALVLGVGILPWGLLVRCIPLDWCYGPVDDDPTQMSALERALHLPKRKARGDLDGITGVRSCADNVGDDFGVGKRMSDDGEAVLRKGSKRDAVVVARQRGDVDSRNLILRLRVFVHAVAFVNVVSRGKIQSSFSEQRCDDIGKGNP